MRIVTRKTAGANGKTQSFLIVSAKEYKQLKKIAMDDEVPKSLSPEEREALERQEALEIEGPQLTDEQELAAAQKIDASFFEDEESEGKTKADQYMNLLIELQESMRSGVPPSNPKLDKISRKVLRISPEEEIPVSRLQEVMSYLVNKYRKSKKR